jgi:hypothetical protein
MAISVTDPVSPAIERTKEILFRPFETGRWFTIGLCSWLSHWGSGGGNAFQFRVPSGGGGGRGSGGAGRSAGSDDLIEDLNDVIDKFLDNLPIVLTIFVIVVVLATVITGVVLWVGSRGQFMFLDCVVRNREEVTEPWHSYRRLGDSLFCFRFLFGLATLLLSVAVVIVGVIILWSDLRAEQFGMGAFLGLLVIFGGVLLVALVDGVVGLFLHDFVVPLMYLHGLTVLPAWRTFNESMLRGRAGTFALYVLFKLLIGLAIGMAATAVTCATCCIAALPYIGAVILLPLSVFERCYSLYFMEQFGPTFQIIRTATGPDFDDRFDDPPRPDRPNRAADDRFRPR